jgi:hypothetical protein
VVAFELRSVEAVVHTYTRTEFTRVQLAKMLLVDLCVCSKAWHSPDTVLLLLKRRNQEMRAIQEEWRANVEAMEASLKMEADKENISPVVEKETVLGKPPLGTFKLVCVCVFMVQRTPWFKR